MGRALAQNRMQAKPPAAVADQNPNCDDHELLFRRRTACTATCTQRSKDPPSVALNVRRPVVRRVVVAGIGEKDPRGETATKTNSISDNAATTAYQIVSK
jgi:hypothetical protein